MKKRFKIILLFIAFFFAYNSANAAITVDTHDGSLDDFIRGTKGTLTYASGTTIEFVSNDFYIFQTTNTNPIFCLDPAVRISKEADAYTDSVSVNACGIVKGLQGNSAGNGLSAITLADLDKVKYSSTANINNDDYVAAYKKVQSYLWIYKDVPCETSLEMNSVTSTGSISLSSAGSLLTLSGEYFVSPAITVNKSNISTYTISLSNAPTGTIVVSSASSTTNLTTSNSGTLYIKVPKNSVTGNVSNITLTVSGTYTSKTYDLVTPTVTKYKKTVGDAAQDIGLIDYSKQSKTETKTASDNVKFNIKPYGSVTIEKVDANDTTKKLQGATFRILTSDGNRVTNVDGQRVEDVTTGADGKATFAKLPYGTYTITEIVVPDGYIKIADKTVTVSSANVNQTVKLSNSQNRTKISKQDLTTSEELPGATLKITDSNRRDISCTIEKTVDGRTVTETLEDCTWVSGTDPVYIIGLKNGTYHLTETQAPDGYIISDEIEFTIVSGRNTGTQTMKNEQNKTVISKQSITNSSELPGATLRITDINNQPISCTIQTIENGTQTLEDCTWVSGAQPAIVIGLKTGRYYLEETLAPSGFVLNTEKIEFEIRAGKPSSAQIMKNSLNKVQIYKLTAENNQPLVGASLEIQDVNGEVVNYCLDEAGENLVACKWVSTENPYEIEGMPNGTYYLVETAAPEGYVLNTEKKEFVVDGTVPVIEVKMQNKAEVPDTQASRSTLLIVIAAFVVALGIGLVAFIKRKAALN